MDLTRSVVHGFVFGDTVGFVTSMPKYVMRFTRRKQGLGVVSIVNELIETGFAISTKVGGKVVEVEVSGRWIRRSRLALG